MSNLFDEACLARMNPPALAGGGSVQMTGFRNVIAHAYDDLDYDIVFDVLHNGRNDIDAFLEALEY